MPKPMLKVALALLQELQLLATLERVSSLLVESMYIMTPIIQSEDVFVPVLVRYVQYLTAGASHVHRHRMQSSVVQERAQND